MSKARKFKNQKAAQDAHEAIRPTSVLRTPEQMANYLNDEQLSLYTLIWKRFVASQMSSAEFDHTTVDIDANQYRFRATGSIMRFAGFTTLYEEAAPEASAQDTTRGKIPTPEKAVTLRLLPKQHTQPAFTNLAGANWRPRHWPPYLCLHSPAPGPYYVDDGSSSSRLGDGQ